MLLLLLFNIALQCFEDLPDTDEGDTEGVKRFYDLRCSMVKQGDPGSLVCSTD
jgi:hypothetical protein